MTIVAPPPEQSTAVDPQLLFEEARQRRRRRRLIAGVVLVVATALVVATVVAIGGTAGPPNPVPPTPAADRFVPPTTTTGDTTTMRLTLPDGRGFALTYPSALDLGQFAQTAGGRVDWIARSGPLQCCGEYVAPQSGSVAAIFSGKPLAVYRGAHGRSIPYYAGSQERFPLLFTNMDYLTFQFGPWVVLVGDMVHSSYRTARMTDGQRATWARAFDAHVTGDGYLVFRPHPPLALTRGSIDIVLRHTTGSLEISGPVRCGTPQIAPTVDAGVTSWCDPRSDLRVAATGSVAFTQAAASGLRIATLRPVS